MPVGDRFGVGIQASEKEQLKRSEKELAQPLLLCDLTGSRYWNMLYCNDAFTSITGTPFALLDFPPCSCNLSAILLIARLS